MPPKKNPRGVVYINTGNGYCEIATDVEFTVEDVDMSGVDQMGALGDGDAVTLSCEIEIPRELYKLLQYENESQRIRGFEKFRENKKG